MSKKLHKYIILPIMIWYLKLFNLKSQCTFTVTKVDDINKIVNT